MMDPMIAIIISAVMSMREAFKFGNHATLFAVHAQLE
jgi:hypothetical protein